MYPADSILLKNPVTENPVFSKKFKKNLLARYKGSDFDYSTSKPKESFLDKLERKINKILQNIFGIRIFANSANTVSLLIRLFAIILVGFLLYFIVKYLLAKNGNLFFGKRNNKLIINEENIHENIHEINFPESIAKFERAGDFRSAVRYQFLFILKKLSDKKLIIWNPEKTNQDYATELKTANLKNDFFNLSYIFDYVWYGEFIIDEENYFRFKKQYQDFNI